MPRLSALWRANFIAFISSFCVMVIELIAARILAPYIGISLYTWTSIIGVILTGIAAGVLIAALSSDDGGGGAIKLPDFVNAPTAPKDSAKAYQFAVDYPDYLSQVPCYCGCYADGHESNLDCFIKSRDGDDVEFDRHGAG